MLTQESNPIVSETQPRAIGRRNFPPVFFVLRIGIVSLKLIRILPHLTLLAAVENPPSRLHMVPTDGALLSRNRVLVHHHI